MSLSSPRETFVRMAHRRWGRAVATVEEVRTHGSGRGGAEAEIAAAVAGASLPGPVGASETGGGGSSLPAGVGVAWAVVVSQPPGGRAPTSVGVFEGGANGEPPAGMPGAQAIANGGLLE